MAEHRKLLPGIAVLLLHAGLIALLAAPIRPEPRPDTRRMLVWLTPPAVPPARPKAAATAPEAAPAIAPAIASTRRPVRATPSRARQPDAAKPAASAEQQPAMAVVPAAPPAPASDHATADPRLPADPFAPATTPVQGKFDVNAAMESARKLATAKSTKGDPAVAQIQDKPLYGRASDTPLGSAVHRTARPDCKNIASGAGILALVILPAMILTDKKDSGCKW